MQRKKQSRYVDRTQRQFETALTSALQNKNTTTNLSSTILLLNINER